MSFAVNYFDYFTGTYIKEEQNEISNEEIKYIKNIACLSCEQFYYKNLPEDLTSQIIELALFYRNNLCFVKDNNTDRVVLATYIPNGNFNIYLKPDEVKILYLNGLTLYDNYKYDDIVPIRDNIMGIPPILCIKDYIQQLTIADRTFDITMFNLRLPMIFKGSQEMKAQLMKLYDKMNKFEPVIFTNSKGFKDVTESFNFTPSVNPIDLYDVIKELKNQALQTVGVYSDTGKKERLLVSEISSQNDFVDMIYQSRLRNRKEAINLCNKKFGTEIIIEELYQDIQKQNALETHLQEKAKQVKESERINNENEISS